MKAHLQYACEFRMNLKWVALILCMDDAQICVADIMDTFAHNRNNKIAILFDVVNINHFKLLLIRYLYVFSLWK